MLSYADLKVTKVTDTLEIIKIRTNRYYKNLINKLEMHFTTSQYSVLIYPNSPMHLSNDKILN